MSKTVKILLFLTFIALLLVFYLIMSSKIITVKTEDKDIIPPQELNLEPKAEKIDLRQLEIDYKEKIKPIFNEFEQMITSFWTASSSGVVDEINDGEDIGPNAASPGIKESETLKRISKLEIILMDITVPEQYKDFHWNLFQNFLKIKNSIEGRQETGENNGIEFLTRAKNEYEWLAR